MSDFNVLSILTERKPADKLWVHRVMGDGMAPELRPHDYVLLAPTERYCGEGIYLLHDGIGPDLFRVQAMPRGKVLMKHDNPFYILEHTVTKDEFEEIAKGYVVADIRVRDSGFLNKVARSE